MLTFALALSVLSVQAQTLRWSARSDTRTMDPYGYVEGVNHNLNSLVYDALVDRDTNDRFVPALATRWVQVDRLTWRFTLRQGVKFHDGSALTIGDVVFSIQRAQHPTSPFSTFALPLGTPVAVDASTLELRMTQPNPLALQQVSFILIMSRDWAIANQSERVAPYAQREQAYAAQHAMGTGRYMLKERVSGVRTVFVRNPAWWGKFEGNVAEVVYLPIDNDATRTAALVAGDIDFVQDPPPQDLERIAATPSLRLASDVENRIILFGFDQWRDELLYSNLRGRNPFKDVRVREAFFRAVNAEALKTSIMRGQARPTACLAIAPAGCMAHELEARNTPDLARARALMAEAGYAEGFDLTLDCPNDRYVNDQRLCVAMVGMLARIGVRLKVDARPRTLSFPRLQAGDTSFYMFGWGGLDADAQAILETLLHSRVAGSAKGANNVGHIVDPEMDRLIDAAAVETDVDARAALIRDAQRRAFEKVYYLPLHRQMLSWAMRANVHPVVTSNNMVRVDWIRID